jgi:hypothetical protein
MSLRTVWARLVVLLSAMPAAGQRPPSPVSVRLLQANQAGVPMVWEILTARADALPRWDLDVAPPTLSVEDATRTARTWLCQQYPQVERFLIQQLTLPSVGAGFWYYTALFRAPGPPSAPYLFFAVVLPDGSLLEPESTGA